MAPTLPVFPFEDFARDIYRERSNVHSQPFLLPALYGGELVEEYEALFVLEEPSVPFTEARWKQCNTTEAAIRNHRQIFLDWAYRGIRALLFKSLFTTVEYDLFKRFYVTDVWKDAAFKENRRNQGYREYWLSKLAIELQHVCTRCVIFVGKEAARAGRPLIQGRRILAYDIPFPNRISRERFKEHVASLAGNLHGLRPSSASAVDTEPSVAKGTTRPIRDPGNTSSADRDALWHEALSSATPLKAAGVLAAHPDAAVRAAMLIAEPTASRVVAIANAMYNPCRPEHLAATGRAASEEAWAIVLSRRDVPYMRTGTRWERLVIALDPIPEWAADRLRNMDIVALGGVARALIQGPYRRV